MVGRLNYRIVSLVETSLNMFIDSVITFLIVIGVILLLLIIVALIDMM